MPNVGGCSAEIFTGHSYFYTAKKYSNYIRAVWDMFKRKVINRRNSIHTHISIHVSDLIAKWLNGVRIRKMIDFIFEENVT